MSWPRSSAKIAVHYDTIGIRPVGKVPQTDDSPIVRTASDLVKALGETLIAMTVEEVGELLESGEDPEDEDAAEIGAPRAARALQRGLFAMLRQAAGRPMANR